MKVLHTQTWRRLAEGRAISPHEVEQMAMSLQIAPAVATSTVSKLSERDSEGNFVGFSGLSLKTHPHRLRVNGHRLSTWCAWDCLFIPLFLKQTVKVQSICPATKTNITLMITPERVANHDPTRTVISMITPRTTKRGLDSAEEIRMDFCRYVHFLSSPEAASQWIASKKLDISTLSVEEGYQLGRLVFAEFLKYA